MNWERLKENTSNQQRICNKSMKGANSLLSTMNSDQVDEHNLHGGFVFYCMTTISAVHVPPHLPHLTTYLLYTEIPCDFLKSMNEKVWPTQKIKSEQENVATFSKIEFFRI